MRELTNQKSQIKLNEVFMSTNGIPNYGSTSSISNGCYTALYESDRKIATPVLNPYNGASSIASATAAGAAGVVYVDGNLFSQPVRMVASVGPITVTLSDGNKYHGYLENGKPQGIGTFWYSANDLYGRKRFEGTFVDGIPGGQGKLVFSNGNTITGEFNKDGEGNGTIDFAVGVDLPIKFVGTFKNYVPDIGVMTQGVAETRTTYTGTWQNGTMWNVEVFDRFGNTDYFIKDGKSTFEEDRRKNRERLYGNDCCVIL